MSYANTLFGRVRKALKMKYLSFALFPKECKERKLALWIWNVRAAEVEVHAKRETNAK
jgi:hypothetical protein